MQNSKDSLKACFENVNIYSNALRTIMIIKAIIMSSDQYAHKAEFILFAIYYKPASKFGNFKRRTYWRSLILAVSHFNAL